MTMQFFGTRGSNEVAVSLPLAYRSKARWVPRIGDVFPDFTAPTTHGKLRFHDWAEGSWVYLFSHPAAFTPVCTSEMVGLAGGADAFAARDIKLMSLSRDTLDDQCRWSEDIARVFGTPVTFPMISDTDGVIARICGMLHEKEDPRLTARKSILIDPALRLRMIFEYPVRVGRSVDEILRVFDALSVSDELDVATPSDWKEGDPLLLMHTEDPRRARARFRGPIDSVLPYLHLVNED